MVGKEFSAAESLSVHINNVSRWRGSTRDETREEGRGQHVGTSSTLAGRVGFILSAMEGHRRVF